VSFKFSSVVTRKNENILACNVQFSKTVSDRHNGPCSLSALLL
jgi:hypothetical protein